MLKNVASAIKLSNFSLMWSLLLLIMCIAIKHSTPAEFVKVPDLPVGLPRCTKDDRDINECLKSAFQQLIRTIKNGIPELNIPIIEPWAFDLNGYQYSNDNLQVDIQVKNVLVYGMSEMIIDSVDFRLRKDGAVRMVIISHVPQVFVEGLYSADLTINGLRYKPNGYFNASAENFKMTRHPAGKLVKRNGHIYLRLLTLDATPEVDDLKLYFSGLLPDPALNAALLEIINKYWRQIYKALGPDTRLSWEPIVIRKGNRFFTAFPFDLILNPNLN